MSPAEIYQLARGVGFSIDAAVRMTAIAMRESSGDPNAFNGNAKTGDKSYGLWQINMYRTLAPERMRMFGLSAETDLFRPEVNARAAFILSRGGSESALRQHWYVDRWGSPYGYAEKYTQNLEIARAAAAEVDGVAPELPAIGAGVVVAGAELPAGGPAAPEPAPWWKFGGVDAGRDRDLLYASAGVGAALVLYMLFGD